MDRLESSANPQAALPDGKLRVNNDGVDAEFELFDHTADMGLRVRAVTMPSLLMPAAQALYAAIGFLKAGGPTNCRRIELTDDESAYLLRDFLTELLILFEREARMAVRIDPIAFEAGRLIADVYLAEVDERESAFHREVKAVTYHELAIVVVPGGFEATVIVDI